MQQRFSGFAKDCHVWVDETPDWAAVDPVGVVEGYFRSPGQSHLTATRSAAWGFRVGHGGKGSFGLLGATFTPHSYPHLRASVPATTARGRRCPKPFDAARVGLPHEYVGGALTGALQEPGVVGAGHLSFGLAATHDVDSSWEVFRLLAIGVVRLLAVQPDKDVPEDLLPFFGGEAPAAPGG